MSKPTTVSFIVDSKTMDEALKLWERYGKSKGSIAEDHEFMQNQAFLSGLLGSVALARIDEMAKNEELGFINIPVRLTPEMKEKVLCLIKDKENGIKEASALEEYLIREFGSQALTLAEVIVSVHCK